MTYETLLEIGVDVIAPACTIFTIWYWFRPWRTHHIGRAIMAHSFGSMLLFDLAFLVQYNIISENYPGNEAVTLTIIVLWAIGWWYMVFALWLTRHEPKKVRVRS